MGALVAGATGIGEGTSSRCDMLPCWGSSFSVASMVAANVPDCGSM